MLNIRFYIHYSSGNEYLCSQNRKNVTMKLLEKKITTDSIGGSYMPAFVLITICFALWGFANNVTSPMVGTFSKIFRMSTTEGVMVPVAFNLGYFCMAIPAALFIQRFSFKWGVLAGLTLYAVGALLFLPAKAMGMFAPFLAAYFIMTCGLSFLETSCNPYIYSMGNEQTGIQRLNAAQSFNALGSLMGMLIAMYVQSNISPMDSLMRQELPQKQFDILKDHDLGVLIQPYIYIVAVILIIMAVMWVTRMPRIETVETDKKASAILHKLLHRVNYREGWIAEFCYVGAQAACWTFIIQYGSRIFIAEGLNEQGAEVLAQKFNIAAMVLFAFSRFICTWLMRFFTPERMLSTLAIVGTVLVFGVIAFTNRYGLYCLVGVSACLSLMFPTIFGLSLHGVGEDIKLAGAGLIMAILGGSLFPPIQAVIIESKVMLFGLPSTNLSFFIPMLCLGVVAWYGHRTYVRHYIQEKEE